MSKRPSKILVVDDHPLVREWVGRMIARQDDLILVGEAESVSEALAEAKSTQPDLAIVDVSLRGSSGFELIRTLAAEHPHIAVLALTMHDEAAHAERAIRLGARGYVMKSESMEGILLAVRQVLAGKLAVSDLVTSMFAAKFLNEEGEMAPSIQALSDRELEIFGLLGQGYDAQRIAHALDITVKAVHANCLRIREKLALPNPTQLLLEAVHWHEGGTPGDGRRR